LNHTHNPAATPSPKLPCCKPPSLAQSQHLHAPLSARVLPAQARYHTKLSCHTLLLVADDKRSANSVLPPPPRYPNGQLYTGMPGGALLETNNTLSHPTGPEYQLVVGEGTYVLRDDMHLATPPPHPSDAPQPNNNPLATTIGPPTAGTKLSTVVFAPKRSPQSQSLFRTITSQSVKSNFQSIQEESHASKSDAGSSINGFGSTAQSGFKATFGDGNPALVPVAVKGRKKDERAKPKNNIVKSNSSFVSRVIPHESAAKRLAEHQPDGIFAFANVNRAFMWLDLSAPSDMKTENMTKVLFTKAHAICHDVNRSTQCNSHIDVILGFNTGDMIWYEPISQKYSRINKNGIINNSAVSAIWWLPNKENYFLAAHMDGSLIVYDKEREDAEFIPEESSPVENGYSPDGSTNGDATPRRQHKLNIKKSVQSRNQKTNPVSVWKLSNQKINAVAFSPDGRHLAAVAEDGTLTIMDYLAERVLDVHRSYFGAMLTVTWSPDSRYVLTGGQDDLVSIWSVADQALVARCVGHESWVRDVKFDPWRCDERNYRFGSVGEDCRLLLWDFSVGMLGRPKIGQHRPSITNGSMPLGREKSHSISMGGRMRSKSNLSTQPDESVNGAGGVTDGQARVHAVDSKASTATLPPVMSKIVDKHPVSWLEFQENCIITSCDNGEYLKFRDLMLDVVISLTSCFYSACA
jgi:WD40 repeat protein